VIPRGGYLEARSDADETLYVYQSQGRIVIAIVVSSNVGPDNADPWVADELRACDWTEWGADADLGPGYAAWERPDGRVAWAVDGAGHCGWESTTLLHLGKHAYARDPQGVLDPTWLTQPYEHTATLPPDAYDSTYRRGERELWLAADKSAAYAVGANRTESWPRTIQDFGCT
jgi:hypothetical protein